MTATARALPRRRPLDPRRAALVLLLALLCTVAAVLLAGPASAAPTDPVAPTAPTARSVPGDGDGQHLASATARRAARSR